MNYKNDFLNYTECLYSQKREAFAEGDTLLPDYYPPIMRIIGTEAVAVLKSASLYGKKLVSEGAVEFRVIYQAENGSVNSVFAKVPFSDSVELNDSGIDDGCFTDVAVSADYFDCRALSPQKVHMKASVCLSQKILAAGQASVLTATEGGDDVELRYKETAVSAISCFGKKTLRISDTLPVKEGFDKLLRYDVGIVKGENKKMARKLIAKGDMVLKTVLWSDAKKTAEAVEQKIPVSQIIEIPDLSPETEVFVSIRPSDIKVEMTESADKKELTYDIELSISVQGYKTESKNLILDAFSPSKELACEKRAVLCDTSVYKDDRISFTEKLDIPTGGQVCDLSVKPRSVGIYAESDGTLALNGFFGCCLTALDEQGDLVFSNKAVPFTVRSEKKEGAPLLERAWGDAELAVESLAYVTDGGELEFRIDCRICGSIFVSEKKECISSIAVGEEKCKKDAYPMLLCYAEKGERLWDIAKKYSVPLGRVIADNKIKDGGKPVSEYVLTEDRMLVI